ncbi:MAG: MaoC family dehydratase N-terminal domain-containing protein [Myxococcales bacterium]|nr:MaoC family dehydratase N-terminal domain-containing protein [Myxococcales bacterium]
MRVGDAREEVVVDDLSRTQIVMYAGASGDFQPLHTDEPFARAMGFRGTFAHGMLTMGLAGKPLAAWVGHDRLLRYRARFLAQVWPGDTLTTRLTLTAVRADALEADVAIETRNQDGVAVLAGDATARLDP